MPYYEIVYETGNHSVAYYEGDDEAQTALRAHHEKAKTGESATPASTERTDVEGVPGPTAWPAERIAKVYKFDAHPADFGASGQVPVETLTQNLEAMKDAEGNVDTAVASSVVRNASAPFAQPEAPHDSDYAAPHEELQWVNE
jgi:hypothetical protein